MKKSPWNPLLRRLPSLLPLAAVFLLLSKGYAAVALTEGGQPKAALVLPDAMSKEDKEAAEELRWHVKKASGAELEIVSETDVASLPESIARVYIGATRRAEEKGIVPAKLEPDQFRILAGDGEIILAGSSARKTNPTRWAVQEILDRHLGVRWLWPGELGTYVPANADIVIPDLDVTWQHPLEYRSIRHHLPKMKPQTGGAKQFGKKGQVSTASSSMEDYEKLNRELGDWIARQRMGNRSEFNFGHAFGDWWDKYHEEHPDLFAVPPPGETMPYPKPDRVKLRISSPKVDEFILAEWRAAGKPPVWNVCPNDGAGFDTSPETLAMDYPQGQDVMEIWNGDSTLTARYVRFWNRLIEKMRAERPDAELCTYFYSRYLNPPPEGLKLSEGIVGGLVVPYDEEFYTIWGGWHRAGAQRMVLRPQWLMRGAGAPYIPLEEMANAFHYAMKHGLVGVQYGGIYGYWAANGLSTYLLSRLSWRPDMTKDEIVDEYCSAFGKAAPEVKKYINFWEQFSKEAAYPFSRRGGWRSGRGGKYEKAVLENDLSQAVHNRGPWEVMPFLYPDETLKPAYALLDAAAAAAANDTEEVQQRVQFLRDGLDHLRATRDAASAGRAAMRDKSPEARQEHERLYKELREVRDRLTPSHAVWGGSAFFRESGRGGRTIPEMSRQKTEEVDPEQED